ncbi:MAG: FHA domain-containing protein [Thermodesulfobacteriota bacterium]
MATIILRSQHREIARYAVESGQNIQIGRSPGNDIVIDNPAVSGRHAMISADDMGFVIKDAGSRNGTFINGKPVVSRRLADGDVITIGKHELIFSDHAPLSRNDNIPVKQGSTHSAPPPAADQTVFLATKQQQELLDRHNRAGHKAPLLVVKYKGEVLYKYLLKYRETGVGRGAKNRVVIDNAAVSSRHALITAADSGFTISDLGSKNGTFVNKKPITECKLHNGDTITIGRHELVFEETGTYTYDDIAQPLQGEGPSLNSSDATTFLSTREYREMSARSRPHDLSRGANPKPGLTFLKGGVGHVPIDKELFRIGKSKSSDIVAKGLLVGHTAALITSKADGCHLTCQSGLSKPLVNGRKVRQSMRLNNGDTIKIGRITLEFNV